MESIKTIYKIGSGPSSSHTMGPENATKLFVDTYTNKVDFVKITLYGSLALTGKGHLTDYIIEKILKENNIKYDLDFNFTKADLPHENTMTFEFKVDNEEKIWTISSIGGGDIKIIELESEKNDTSIYKENTFDAIKLYCQKNNIDLLEYILENEPDILEYMSEVWNVMNQSIQNGLNNTGFIPGDLKLQRKAHDMYQKSAFQEDMLLATFAQAVNEENASGGIIVTAPTCGACGILPSCLRYYKEKLNLEEIEIAKALAIAGLFANLVRTNASISGAEAGCQAEVGTATSIAAAAITYLQKGDIEAIESSAEIGLEHQLGLTCDPVLGYVQIPCIQRNAVGAIKANLASKIGMSFLDNRIISFDTIVDVMYETGKDLKSGYRETSTSGLAKYYKKI